MQGLAPSTIFQFEGFRLDRRGGLFRRDNTGAFVPIAIGSRALDILGVLIERAGEVVSKDEIVAAVWPETVVEDSNLTVQISKLRRVLDKGRSNGSCIQTVAGRGYRFVAPISLPASGAAAGTTHPAPRLSIVVLPFANLGNNPEQQYFADGIAEDLTTDLSRIPHSFVISCNTAFTYRNKPVDTKQIGRELGVRYVLEGSVRRSGDQLRVTAQLIDAETDGHLWGERFDCNVGDLFALQNDLTSRIAAMLSVELVTAEAARPSENPDALDYVLRGRVALKRPPSRDRYPETISLFERALALDPLSVAAQSYLASTLMERVHGFMSESPAADIARAEGLVGQALAVSPRSPLAHYAKAQALRAQNRFDEALSEYETALAYNRNWTGALNGLGICKLATGSPEAVIPLFEQAIRLSPRDPEIGLYYFQIGRVHLLQSHVDEAILWLEKARAAMPEHVLPHAYLASAYGLEGEAERAAAELAEARRLANDDRYSSLTRLRLLGYWGVPSVRALYETTYFAGLRKAGMPEE